VNGACATASCNNGVQDSYETDSDCGGPMCHACSAGLRCKVASDCAGGACTDSMCLSASCTDQMLDGNETETDCGGSDCGPCGLNARCSVDKDCASGHCVQGACVVPCPASNQGPPCPTCSIGTACCRTDRFCGCKLNALICE
jgi:hypothetical protein